MVGVNETIRSSGAVDAKTSKLIRDTGKNILVHARNATGEASEKIGGAAGNIVSDLWNATGRISGDVWNATSKTATHAWQTTGGVAEDVWDATKNISGELFKLSNSLGDKAWDHITEEKNILPYGIAASIVGGTGLLIGYQMLTAKSRTKKRKKAHRVKQKQALKQAKGKIVKLEAAQKAKDAQFDQLLQQSNGQVIPQQTVSDQKNITDNS